MKKSGKDIKPCTSLCLDCANATKPWRCPWVNNFTPIEGWVAEPTQLYKPPAHYESFDVKSCPSFVRDAYGGGRSWDDVDGNRVHTKVDNRDTVTLAEAIIEQAVRDWKYIDYGQLGDKIHSNGTAIWRDELLEFFFSSWFEVLLASFSPHSAEQIRRMIRITDDMRPGVRK